jgi:hypothetical protein
MNKNGSRASRRAPETDPFRRSCSSGEHMYATLYFR